MKPSDRIRELAMRRAHQRNGSTNIYSVEELDILDYLDEQYEEEHGPTMPETPMELTEEQKKLRDYVARRMREGLRGYIGGEFNPVTAFSVTQRADIEFLSLTIMMEPEKKVQQAADRVIGCVKCGKPCALVGDLIPEDELCCWCRGTTSQVATKADELWEKEQPPCDQPPEGWYCTRGKGHAGPCAMHPGERP